MLTGAICSGYQCTCSEGLTVSLYLVSLYYKSCNNHYFHLHLFSICGADVVPWPHWMQPANRMKTVRLPSTASLSRAGRTSVNVPMDSTRDPRTFAVAYSSVSYHSLPLLYPYIFHKPLSFTDAGDVCTINADCQGLGENHRCNNFKCDFIPGSSTQQSDPNHRSLGVQTSIDFGTADAPAAAGHTSVGVNTSIDQPEDEATRDDEETKCKKITRSTKITT